MIGKLLFTTVFSFLTALGFSQCMDWVNPTPTGGWTDLIYTPCNGNTIEWTEFQIVQSEAYELEGVVEGANYTFSACNGSGAGSWDIDYTILSPSGAVDAFGSDSDSPCSITWTASETGIYRIVINKTDECGIEGDIENGYPKLTTNSGGMECPEPPVYLEGAESFENFNGALPLCWQTAGGDNNGNSWIIFNEPSLAFHASHIIASRSYQFFVGPLNPNNYLITPKLNIETEDSLYYAVSAVDLNNPEESYSVLVSTTGTAVEDFTDVLLDEVLDGSGWSPRTINLSAYAGQSIYIAFRHYASPNGWAMMLDAISLPGGVECDISVCQEWVNPTPTTGRVELGEVPCIGSVTEIDEFEITASEAYLVTGIKAGGNYTFSACNGPNAGSWEIEYTIISPSGYIDNFGSDEDSPCAITWTASENGDYLIVINQVGQCGITSDEPNGNPRIVTNTGGVYCEGPDIPCMGWGKPSPTTAWSDMGEVPCTGSSKENTNFEVDQGEAYMLFSVMEGANYTFSTCNGANAGSWDLNFTVISPSGVVEAFGTDENSLCSITWTASEDGNYIVAINKVGECGIYLSNPNGHPMITTNSGGTVCPPPPVYLDGAESFEVLSSGLMPKCWKKKDADGDGKNWLVMNFGSDAFHGSNAIASFSWDQGIEAALTPDNYLITPQLNLGEGDSLYFIVKTLNEEFPYENYSVMLSTTGNEVADFTAVLFTEMLNEDAATWKPRTIHLDEYNNQSIYLAFRHHVSSDMVGLALDAIKLPGEVVDCTNISVETEGDRTFTRIYPNPASSELYITTDLNENATITIWDAVGRVVLERHVKLMSNEFIQDISGVENGVYLIQVKAGDKLTAQRFIKQ